ncbi:hypothetical protein [Paenibacillus oryzisoli]|uniref:Uncharacterized protein n=1 Tax=Paenibacillus oryzisoli TaxID=1850517 RepID=A0A198AJA2_9BACL|nr:hypothetical protein [Paenibacillus oryzisoli]OAS21131.1 hypothetical protein A8708_30030 [Paenibacillus oryzisoli]
MADQLIREALPFQSTPLCPVPQYWNGTSYEKVQGAAGAMSVVIQGGVAITGGTSSITVADGSDAALGAKADASVSTAGNGSVIALLKGLQSILGLVGASPTANTVNDRLKTLATSTGAITDAAATGDGSLIAILKQLRTILTDAWDDPNNALRVRSTILATPVVGTQANAWSAVAAGVGATSTAVDTQYQPQISAFGNASAATTITLQVSQDNTNFYDTPVTQVLAGAGNFHLTVATGARYARLKTSAAATITATIAGK